MIKNKYNIGDIVLIRNDLQLWKRYGVESIAPLMLGLCGKYARITGNYDGTYRIEGSDYHWTEEMFVGKVNEIDSAFNNLSKLFVSNNMTMPNIVNYTYNPKIALTTIEWADGTKTTVRAESPNKADQYTGFVTAVAKKACGNDNTINNLYDEWAVKKSAKELEKQILINNKLLEEKRIAKKRKAKREQYLIRKEALKLKREHEAKKLAHEKYGIPFEDDEK